MPAKKLPYSNTDSKCGHNFNWWDCPYKKCLLRTYAKIIMEDLHETKSALIKGIEKDLQLYSKKRGLK